MAALRDLMDKLRQGFSSAQSKLSSSFNDNKGLFQGGKFTPVKAAQQGITNWAQRNPQSAYKIINVPQQVRQNVSNFVRNPVRPIIRQAGGLYTGLTNPMRQTLTKNFGEQLGGTLATLPPSVTFGAPQLAGKIPKVVNFLSKVGKEIPFYSMVGQKAEEGVRRTPVGKVPYVPEAVGFIAPFFIGGVSPKRGIKNLSKAGVKANFAKFRKQIVEEGEVVGSKGVKAGKKLLGKLEPLAQEARKYKSAEEFVNGNGIQRAIKILTGKDKTIGDYTTSQEALKILNNNGYKNLVDFYNQAKKVPPVQGGVKNITSYNEIPKWVKSQSSLLTTTNNNLYKLPNGNEIYLEAKVNNGVADIVNIATKNQKIGDGRKFLSEWMIKNNVNEINTTSLSEGGKGLLKSLGFEKGIIPKDFNKQEFFKLMENKNIRQEWNNITNKSANLTQWKIEFSNKYPSVVQGGVSEGMFGTQNRMKAVVDETKVATKQVKLPLSNKPLLTNTYKIVSQNKIPTQEQVASELPAKIDNFIEKTLGYSTKNPVGGIKEASTYTKILRKAQEGISSKVEAGLGSENKYIRNAASTLQNFFRGIGMSPERSTASMDLRGSISTARERAYNVMDSIYKSLGDNENSLERINAVLDPSISKTKVTFNQLTDVEKQAYGIIREGLDLVHDTSYANGHISKELYIANKGKYTPRLYDVMELPAEVNKFVTQGKKIVNDLYKQRKNLDVWKIENSLNDPVYGLGKRLAQVETNTAIKKYTDFLVNNSQFISSVEKKGFIKLSDSPAYGKLSGKFVLNSVAEDLKGFFYSNTAMQNLYDVFRAYDRMPIRQLQKKLLTVFNPTTNVGNIVSDNVFGFVTGVDPLTLNKKILDFKSNPSSFKQFSDYLMRKGIVGTDITRTDFVDKLAQINDLALGKRTSPLVKIVDKVQSFYGGTDDVYKVAAFKALLDKGFTLEEATRKVADGFQNYANVGKFYDTWAKTPVIGSVFIKFQGDLIRIIKNGAINNPLGLIIFLGTLYGVARLSSKLSGETDKDRVTREDRFGAPKIPGLNIPLTWQTSFGEINAARYISPFFANNEITSISKMFPFIPNINPKKDVASNIAMNANDPLLSPLIQLAVNKDFRGKPISDLNENKYKPSTLTSDEKLKNQAIFAGRSYLPPPVNSAIDIASVASGGKDMYGRTQTVPQSIARMGGIKITQFGAKEAEEQRQKDAEFKQLKKESISKNINAISKQLEEGIITSEEATKRINYFSNQDPKKSVYQSSPEAPKNIIEKISLASKGIGVDPINTIKAIFTEERMRKLSGDGMILERKQFLNKTPQQGDAVDHIIPLSLGGDNSEDNLRYISKEANIAKAKLETKLAKQLKEGTITKDIARKEILNWIENYDPTTIYEYKDDNNKSKIINLSPIKEPKFTGNTELDKKLISKYNSAITTQSNNIVKLYELGQITKEEAEKKLQVLIKQKSTSSKKSSGKKIKIRATPKLKIKAISTKSIKPKKITFKKLKIKSGITKAKVYKISKPPSPKTIKITSGQIKQELKKPKKIAFRINKKNQLQLG